MTGCRWQFRCASRAFRAGFVALLCNLSSAICFSQIIGLVPTPIGMYTWDPVTQNFDTVDISSTSGALQNTPQAFAFYGFNTSLGQWVPCTSIAQCFGGASYEVNGSGIISSNPVNFINGPGVLVSNPSAGNIQFSVNPAGVTTDILPGTGIGCSPEVSGNCVGAVTVTNTGVTEIIPGTNITCTPDSAGNCVGNVTVNATAGGANFQTQVIPPITGQFVFVPAGSVSLISGDPGTGSSSGTLQSGTVVDAGCCGGLGDNLWGVNWTGYTLPSYVLPANITAVYGVAISALSNGPFVSSEITCTQPGGGTISLLPAVGFNSYAMQQVTEAFSVIATSLPTVVCTAQSNHSTPGQQTLLNIPQIGLLVYYTGAAPPVNPATVLEPPLYLNTSVGGAGGTMGVDPNWIFPGLDLMPGTLPLLSSDSYPYGTVFLINNGASATDCSTGGGTTLVLCTANNSGGAYTALSLGSTGTVTSVDGSLSEGAETAVAGTVGPITAAGTIRGAFPYALLTGNQTLADANRGHFLLSADSGNDVYTLPTPAGTSFQNGWYAEIKNGSTTGTITLTPAGATTIDGLATFVVPAHTAVAFNSDGTNYHTTMITPVGNNTADLVFASPCASIGPPSMRALCLADLPAGATNPAVGAIGTVQVSNGSAANAAGTASNISLPMVTAARAAPACEMQGDSYVAGNGPNNAAGLADPNLTWFNLLRPAVGLFCTNKAVGGINSVDINNTQVMSTSSQPVAGQVFVMDTGFINDLGAFSNNANWLLIAQRALQNNLFWNITPNANKLLLQTATMAGGFAVSSTYRAGQGIKSTTNGATASQVVTVTSSGVIDFCHMVLNGNTGTFTVKVDGVTQTDPVSASTTWISGGDGGQAVNTALPTTQFCAGDRLTGFTAGSHTILFTQTAAGTVDIEAVWSPATSGYAIVIMGDMPHQVTDTFTGLYQTIATNAAALGQTDSASGNPYLVAQRTLLGLDSGTNCFGVSCFAADQVHPSAAGECIVLGGATFTNGVCGGFSAPAAGSGRYEANLAGLITDTPYFMGSQSAQLAVPVTVDIAKGFSLFPASALVGSSGFGYGMQTYSFGKGNGNFAFEGVNVPSGATHVFGSTGGSTGYSFCNWAALPSNFANSVINLTSWTVCPIITFGGTVRLGYTAANPTAAISIASNTINFGFAGGVQATFSSNNAANGFQFNPASTATAGNNFGSAYLGWTSNIMNGSSGAGTDNWNLATLPGAGANATDTLSLTISVQNAVAPSSRTIDLTAAGQVNLIKLPPVTAPTYSTTTNCSSSASPAVCGSAAAGSVALPAGTGSTLVVNTTAVTAASEIKLQVDDSATVAGATCNSTLATLVGTPLVVTARTPGVSFTVSTGASSVITTNPVCFSYGLTN
jgi:hypothetical protein